MNILVIEDETLAANRLKSLIAAFNPDFKVLETIDSVKGAIKWFLTNDMPDLVFLDIQLGDGLSFEIFEYCQVKCPIIFTTAYDQYAVQAFKVNSIDYLLKPFDKDDISKALKKLNNLKTSPHELLASQQPKINQAMELLTERYKTRFIVKIGEHIHSIQVKDAAFFFSQEKATFIQLSEGKRYIVDYTLEQITDLLNPSEFFRINRKYLIHINSMVDIVSYSNSRLKIKLKNSDDNDVIVSRDKVQDFKKWLDR